MTRSHAPAISLEALSWSVRDRRILDRVSLGVRAGMVTGLLGPNGSGKTSLLHLLAGLRRPSAGGVRVGDRRVDGMRPRERARIIALVEQDTSTTLDLTVRQVVELGRTPHRSRLAGFGHDDEGIQEVARAMHLADVESLAGRRWSGLSGGERQRTHLARALAQQAQVLLLDEPTNHLDLGHQLDFLDRVRGLGVTVVAALHDLELAAAYCDDVAVLDAGRLVVHGPVAEVLDHRLIAQVYTVDATVGPHPTRDRAHVRWNGVIR
jgi:iron complex transport system ATP-binding protein